MDDKQRVYRRISRGQCPVDDCPGDWKTDRPFYVRCTFDPTHFFAKAALMQGDATPIIEVEPHGP